MAELLFGVEDFDDIPDTLTIDNVVIRTVSVPEPASLPLFGGGIALIVAFGLRCRPRASRSVSALGTVDVATREKAFAR
jgi:hypothetical protein